MKLRYVFVLLAVTIALAFFLQPRYPIKLERAFKTGETFTLVVSGSRRQTTVIKVDEDEKTTDTKYAFEFEGEDTILDVDSSKQPCKQQLTIAKFEKTEDNGQKSVLVNPGTQIVYDSTGGEPSCTTEGPALSREAMEGLKSILTSKGKEHFDQTFGNPSRVAPGAEWPVNTEEAARYYNKNGLHVEPSNLNGTVKLIGTKTVDGVECLHIWSRLTAEKFAGPETGSSAEQTQQFEGYFPIDPTKNIRFEGNFTQLKYSTEVKRDTHKLVTQNTITEETSVERKYPLALAGKP